jgi:hypothetical protein
VPSELPSGGVVNNADVDWDQWPVQRYLAENYRDLHPCDAAVIDHHSAFYRRLAPESVARSLEFGAGPNLYPLMLAAGCSRRIDAVEPSAASIAYLRAQLAGGADPSWEPFYDRCRQRNPALPERLADALAKVRVIAGTGSSVAPGSYDLASMSFVAEGVTESPEEFRSLVLTFIGSVRPGGHLVAAFMESLGSYRLDERDWPGLAVGTADVEEAFEGHTTDLVVSRIDEATLPAYGHTGMLLLTARRSPDH